MAAKSLSVLFVFVSVLVVSSVNEASSFQLGGWRQIPNLKDETVVKIANFAVAEHNKKAKTTLGLVTIVKGETQVVGGLKYRLQISAKDAAAAAAAPKSYTAVVVSQPWKKLLELISFEESKQ